jgi:formylglycine-generating enzyme required for sulfatase activity
MLLTKPQIKKIFTKSQITLKDMKAVASSPKLKGFDSIDLSGKGITDKIGALLICSKHLGGWLNLSNNNLTNNFVKILLKQEVSPNLIKLNLRANRVTSAVISDLVNKYNKDLNMPPDNDNITTICGISICSSSDGRSPRWVKLFDRIQGDGMDFNEIVDFIKENRDPSEVAEESELERPVENISKILVYRTHDRCIGGAMAGSDSRVVNVLYAVEDFFYLKHNLENDMVVEFEKEAFDEVDRRERDYAEDEDEDEDEGGPGFDVPVYDPLKLSEEEEKERAIFIDKVDKKCKRRSNKTGLPSVKDQQIAEGIKLEMVLIPAGKFKMGSKAFEKSRRPDETQHKVTITKSFYMGKYEVTQEQYEAVMGKNPSQSKGVKLPVTDVPWEDCQKFIKKLNKKTNSGYRLPTEAEWEYACRAGTTTAYSFGDEITPKDANYNYILHKPVAVGSYKPNAFGLYDMHGNVWEWCEDWYGDYPAGAVTDPKGAATGEDHVLRGGSFYDRESFARSSIRYNLSSTIRDYNLSMGFRLAKTI